MFHRTGWLLVVLASLKIVLASNPPPSVVSTRKTILPAPSAALALVIAAAATDPKNTSPQDVVQIVETEVWNGTHWKEGDTRKRWTTPQGTATLGPNKVQPPKYYQYVGDWKIVLTPQRDSLGWEYHYQYNTNGQPPIRQRIWLRTIQPIPPQQQEQPITTTTTSSTTPLGAWKYALAQTLRLLSDNWNFKGFGCSLYKSFLSKRSVGLSLAIPLSANWDWWERHSQLPRISSSLGLYYPPMAVAFLSTSMQVDWIRFYCYQLLAYFQYLLSTAVWLFLQVVIGTFFLPWTVLGKTTATPNFSSSSKTTPFSLSSLAQTQQQKAHRQLKLWQQRRAQTLFPEPPSSSRQVQERLSLSVSWRVSLKRGYEFRISGSYLYAPIALATLFPQQDWIKRRMARVGMSTGGPTPDQPRVSCSGCMSMSGIFFWKNTNKKASTSNLLVRSSSKTSPPAARTAGAAAVVPPPAAPRPAMQGQGDEANDEDQSTDTTTVEDDLMPSAQQEDRSSSTRTTPQHQRMTSS